MYTILIPECSPWFAYEKEGFKYKIRIKKIIFLNYKRNVHNKLPLNGEGGKLCECFYKERKERLCCKSEKV